jgi:acetyl esterase
MESETLSLVARARLPLARWTFRRLMGSSGLKRRLAKRRPELDPAIAAMLALDDLSGASRLQGFAPTTARERVHEQVGIVDLPRPANVSVRDLSFDGPGGKQAARLYEPADLEAPSPAILYVHGGGFVTGSILTHDGFCGRLAVSARTRVVSLDYRRAPEHRFPAAVDDALAGARFVLANAEDLGIDPTRVAIAGDSAGGNLSAVISRHLKNEARKIALAVLLYPATDATCSFTSHETLGEGYFLTRESIAWYYDHYYAQVADRRHPDGSPLFADDLAGCPKTIVVTAAFDPLVDEGKAYADKLRQAGVSVEYVNLTNMIHGFCLMAGASSAAKAAAEKIAEQIGVELRKP